MTRNENTKQFLRPNFNEELTKTSLFMLPSIDLDGHTTGYKLLKHFGSLSGLKDANQSEISKLLGKKKTEKLMPYLRAL